VGYAPAVWVPDPAHEALRDVVRARLAAKRDQLHRHRLSKFYQRSAIAAMSASTRNSCFRTLANCPDERGFDPVTTKREFFLIDQLLGRYFRATTMGVENIPAGRALVVAYHSGVIPWDGLLLAAETYRHTGRFSWNAGHHIWGRSAAVKNIMVSTGMVLGGHEDFESLLRRDELVTIFVDDGEGNRRAYYLASDNRRRRQFSFAGMRCKTGGPRVGGTPYAVAGCHDDTAPFADGRNVPLLRAPRAAAARRLRVDARRCRPVRRVHGVHGRAGP
jgi:hypothetical protein